MKNDNLVVCYEGIQRIYRNAVVRFLRSSFSQSFPPGDSLNKLRAPFQKEWDQIKQNAHAARKSGELATPINDDFDLLSVNHFFNLFDAYYDVLCPFISKDVQEKKQQRQALLSWMKTIKNLRDPLSHPSEEDFSREDSFMLLDSARRVLSRLNLQEDADRIKKITDELIGYLSSNLRREPLESQLPQREAIVIDFIGRKKEKKDLWEWFKDPVSRRWALSGEGGKGKSALAYNFALEVKFEAPQPFQTVFWLTAKKVRFLEGSVIATEPDFSDLDSVLSRILTFYGWVDEVAYPTESKRKKVLELLDEFPALIVVDDVDSLESENEDAIEFFSLHLPETKSKVLFTSRRIIFGMGGTTTHVKGFDAHEAAEFILSRCQSMELDSRAFDQKTIQRVLSVTEGSPLYIEELLRFTPTVSSVSEAIKLWESRKGNAARQYALGRECDLLTPNARKVLLASSICPHAISFAEIESISGLDTQTVTAALQELQKLFLFPKPKLIEGEQRFEINLNTKALICEVYGNDDTYRRLQEACRVIHNGVSETGRGAIGAIIRQAIFLEKTSKYEEAEHLLLNALDKYSSNPDLIGVLGKIYKSWQPSRITDAREKFNRAWQLKSSKIEMYEHWWLMEIKEREWTKAAKAADNGLGILRNNRKLLYLSGYAHSRLAKELKRGLHVEKANKEIELAKNNLERALKIKHENDFWEMELNSDIYRALVIISEIASNEKNMRHYLKLWLERHPEDHNAISEGERIAQKYGATGLE